MLLARLSIFHQFNVIQNVIESKLQSSGIFEVEKLFWTANLRNRISDYFLVKFSLHVYLKRHILKTLYLKIYFSLNNVLLCRTDVNNFYCSNHQYLWNRNTSNADHCTVQLKHFTIKPSANIFHKPSLINKINK